MSVSLVGNHHHKTSSEPVTTTFHSFQLLEKECFPLQYHTSLLYKIARKRSFLCLTYPRKTKHLFGVILVEMSRDGLELWSNFNKEAIESVFVLLHSFFCTGKHGFTDTCPQPLAITSRIETINQITTADKSTLHKCVYALSTGERLCEAPNSSTRQKKVVNTTFAATNIIWNMKSTTPDVLKTLVGNQLLVHNVSQSVHRTLNMFGLSTGNKREQCHDIRDGENKLVTGFITSGKRHDLLILVYDNIGFSNCRKVGYEQFTAL